MGASATGERFCRGAAAARKDGRPEPGARGVPSRLFASLRCAHRPRRRRHDRRRRAKLFTELRAALVPLIAALLPVRADDRCLAGDYAERAQQVFGEQVIRAFGYDYTRGRQDKTAHPFMTKLGRGDVRITTRYSNDYLSDGLFSTLHEAGHAIYEQGIADSLEGTPLFTGTTLACTRASRASGRTSWGGASVLAPLVRVAAGGLSRRARRRRYRHVLSRDQPGDPLAHPDRSRRSHLQPPRHAPLRPRARDARRVARSRRPARRMAGARASDLGVTPPDDRDGALQDVHWYGGIVGGAFQSYTLGNIMSAQFFAAARRELSDLDMQIGAGEFEPLRTWLTANIYRHGRKFTAPEIVERATGEPLSIAPYLGYLKTKYGALYGL